MNIKDIIELRWGLDYHIDHPSDELILRVVAKDLRQGGPLLNQLICMCCNLVNNSLPLDPRDCAQLLVDSDSNAVKVRATINLLIGLGYRGTSIKDIILNAANRYTDVTYTWISQNGNLTIY